MRPPVQKILISRAEVQTAVLRVAREIQRTYGDRKIVLVAVLKGSFMFLGDLMKELELDVELEFLYLSSYRGETAPQGEVQHYPLPFPNLHGRHVLIVEDILDTGASLVHAWKFCMDQQPASLRTCVFLVKEGYERKEVPPVHFRGFDIPDEFVVGYGLDYQERYRQLPFIAVPVLPESPNP